MRLRKVRVKLTLIITLLIGCSMLTAGLFMAKLLEDSHIEVLQNNMSRELKVIEAAGDWDFTGTDDALIETFTLEAKRVKAFADARITVVRADGMVLGDSDESPYHMDNHLGRPEIQQAHTQGKGFKTRYSDTLKENMLYAAVPIMKGKEVTGYLRLAMSLQQVDETVRRLWYFLIIGLAVLFLLSGYVSYRTARSITRPIEKVTRVAKQITNMNYKARVINQSNDEIGQLGYAINAMADSLQLQMNRIQENESRLSGVLENMVSGVMMIDRDEQIVLLNPSAEEILGFSSRELLGKKYNEAKQQYEFTKLIEECIEGREHIRDEMIFYYPAERILEINLSPGSG